MQLRQPTLGELLFIQLLQDIYASQTTCISAYIIVVHQILIQGFMWTNLHILWSNNILLSIRNTKTPLFKRKESFFKDSL